MTIIASPPCIALYPAFPTPRFFNACSVCELRNRDHFVVASIGASQQYDTASDKNLRVGKAGYESTHAHIQTLKSDPNVLI